MNNNMNQNQKGSMSQPQSANAITSGNMKSTIEESMQEYGTYTATQDANNEYPPKKNQAKSQSTMKKQNSSMSSQANGTLTAGMDANGKP